MESTDRARGALRSIITQSFRVSRAPYFRPAPVTGTERAKKLAA